MADAPRKKSPRAPSLSLQEAIDGALRIYDKERRHAMPVDIAAQHLGYKSANNGAAIKALASIRYFGLLERPQEGKLAITKEVEEFRFVPSGEHRTALLRRWLKTPPVFEEILENFPDGLPSDGTLRFELIQRGFIPDAAEALVPILKSSVDFAHYYEQPAAAKPALETVESHLQEGTKPPSSSPEPELPGVDRIPVRLAGGRRAWLEIPTPFYKADKERLKRQIDLLLTEEDEAGSSSPAPRP